MPPIVADAINVALSFNKSSILYNALLEFWSFVGVLVRRAECGVRSAEYGDCMTFLG